MTDCFACLPVELVSQTAWSCSHCHEPAELETGSAECIFVLERRVGDSFAVAVTLTVLPVSPV